MRRFLTTRGVFGLVVGLFALLFFATPRISAQENTGQLEGTVTDPSGAAVPGVQLSLTGTNLVGTKTADTDSKGYYRFVNLPPGTYELKATAKGFENIDRKNLVIEAGQVPTINLQLQLGAATATVEVTSAAPLVDTTSTTNVTDLSNSVLSNVPHGLTYQSVIQFAPMARNEPLAGFTMNGSGNGGTGGSLPGSSGNGLPFGYMIGGASDAENAYLVNGQDTEHISGGYSKANVPFQFINSVNMETSGIKAEYGGALGGVVNVVTKSGGNSWHGSFFTTYGGSGVSANNNNAFLRYDPTSTGNALYGIDPASQVYDPREDHFTTFQPGFTIGGPILKNRFWLFAGFAPEFNSIAKTVNFGAPGDVNPINTALNLGNQGFTQDEQTYYTNVRLDAAVTQKIRLYAVWLDQYARESGASLPTSDPVNSQSSFVNPDINTPITNYSHGIGWSAPNATYNFGADITLSPRIIASTRFGYFFENYHDFGWPTAGVNLQWATDGQGAVDNSGQPLPVSLQQLNGATTAAYDPTYTLYNANKHYQLNQDFSFIKSGWWGSHYFKIGYQLNYLHNVINQNGNVPLAYVYAGAGASYSPTTTTGGGNCTTLAGEWGGNCAGQYGYLTVQDFATILPEGATDWNHALYAQDTWNVGHGLTFNLGIRVEKEDLPAPGGVNVPSIHFGWTDKVAPRLGVAWDPTGTGKMKLYASYGVINDVMKLLLAQTSFGAQAFEDCTYALGPNSSGGFNISDINLIFQNNRACPTAGPTVGANFGGTGAPPPDLVDPSGVSLIENVDFRPAEPVAPGVLPFRQHEFTVGWEYEFSPSLAFEVRYDRRRLDHVIEDAALSDPSVFELYTIVNPGQGVNRTIDGYASFLQSLGQAFLVPGYNYSFNSAGNFGTCPTCPPNPTAIRNYDGLEFRVTKNGRNFNGMFSYTYSSLWGNYTGLTTTDQIDGNATGRNSPDTSRAFDEPFFYFKYNGQPNNGPLPTDRPNTFKGYGDYTVPWDHMKTTIGVFQYLYQGTPVSSYTDLAGSFNFIPLEATYIFGRGMWDPITTDANGNMTLGTPYARRTPWYTQTDLTLAHEFEVGEGKSLRFEASIFNLFNQHAVLNYYSGFNSEQFQTPLDPNGISLFAGAALYNTLEHPYNPQQGIGGGNCATLGGASGCTGPNVIKSSWYGQPQQFQLTRNMLLSVTYQF